MMQEEILSMPAGREMDALIAEKIMKLDLKHLPVVYEEGYTSDGEDGWSGWVCPRCRYPEDMLSGSCCQQYSTNIFAAWEVVEKLSENTDGDFSIVLYQRQSYYPRWRCNIIYKRLEPYTSWEDTAPLAICRAALLTTLEEECI